MATPLQISKEKPAEPALNYEYLRTEGLKYIEQLARKIWTDYNVHDPGITILELLCYAITDLGYRTSYPIQDILAEKEDSLQKLHEQFLSAARILPSKPVTPDDYRKLLIDIEGVNNAWLQKADVSYFVDCLESRLSHEKSSGNAPFDQIHLQGLYNILLELEEDILAEDEEREAELVAQVKARLHQHRNLCEDFLNITRVKPQPFIVCAEIEITFDADVNEIQAAMAHEIQNYLTPSVRFYSLQEMFDRGKTAEDIFEGPLLEHGFIDDDELERASLREQIRLSDVIRIIMKIEGVKAVKDIVINPPGQNLSSENKWIVNVSKGHQPILDLEGSRILYYKDLLPYRADKNKVDELLTNLRNAETQRAESITSEDLPFPEGEFQDIQQYYSFQNHFPRNYGISEAGLPESSTPTRKAQAKQLQAYLLFYDQLLANYLAQLSHIKDLFSLDDTIGHTYFSQVVSTLEGVEELYEDVSNLQPELQGLVENREQFLKRRHRFLDHLLGRFAENFNEYSLVMFSTYESDVQEDVLTSKLQFLKEYDQISCARGSASNYTETNNVWDTDNVSGMEHRIARLLGIRDYTRRDLAAIKIGIYQEKDTDNIDEYRFRVIDRAQNKILLSSSTRYYKRDDAIKEMERALTYAKHESGYEVKVTTDGRFYFNIIDDTGEVIARRIEYFESQEACDQAGQDVRDVLQKYWGHDREGIFVVEHLLLRPQNASDQFLPICITSDCSDCENADPYSFRVSVILPAWTARFSDMDFRRFAEKTIRMETPAHILPKICWINQTQMSVFEEKYKKWLESTASGADADSGNALDELVDILSRLRNVYPEAKLSECHDEASPPFIMDRTILGTQGE